MQTNTSESLPRTIPELLENHTIQVQPQGHTRREIARAADQDQHIIHSF